MKNRRGQSTLELALTIVAVAAAAIAMAIFLKRSVMGKMRESGDQVGGQFTPLNTTSDYTKKYTGDQTEATNPNGLVDTTITKQEQTKTGNEKVNQDLTNETLYQ